MGIERPVSWPRRLGAAGLLFSVAGLASAGERVVEEMLVTATKRVERVQDVPISIGVVSGDTIEALRIEDMRDLQNFVPNFTAQSTFGNWVFRVRGVGSGPTNLAFDSSVSIFNDGVYCGRSRCLETALMDAARVEVARGPQGALFGKSTIAGALAVISARPTESFESYVRAGYEAEHSGYFTTAMVSGPLTETLRGRLVGKFEETGGFVDNPYIGGDEPETERWAVRGMLDWDVTDSLLATLKVEHFDTEVTGNTNQLVRQSGLFAALTQNPNAEFRRNRTRYLSTGTYDEDFDNSDSTNYVLTLEQQLGEHTLTAIAGYWELEYRNWLDVDGVPEGFLNTGLSEEYDQTSFEVRLLSPAGNTFDYLAGVSYYMSDTTTRQFSAFGFPPFPADVPVGSDRNFQRDTDTWSVYGQLTWNLTDRIRVIGDLRYTEEEQDGFGHSFPVSFPDRRYPVYTPGAFAQPPEYRFFQNRTDEHLDPALRVQYDATEDMMLYVAYGSGSKPGGLKANDSSLGTQLLAKNSDPAFLQRYIGQPSITAPEMAAGVTFAEGNGIFDFEEEEADNFEVGLKSVFADGRAGLNVAVFWMKFENMQTGTYDGTQFIIKNAAEAKIKGLEFDTYYQATESLRLTGSLGFLDHKYTDFPGAQCIVIDEAGTFLIPGCVDGQQNLAGMPLERTPDYEINLAADWERQIGPTRVVRAYTGIYYSDSYDVREDYHPLGKQDDFLKLDARLALANARDTWEVALIGRNLTDEHTIQHAYEIAAGNFVSFTEGRTVMLQGSLKF
jgi:iron complex outermembrane receptor protein